DSRANEHLGMIALHTLFLREHNRMAEELHKLNPHWSPDTLYQEARKILGAVHQILTWDHYLPRVLGRSANLALMPPYKGYDPAADPSISNIFSTAAFRFAHVTVHPVVNRLGPDYRLSPEHPALPLHHSLFASWRVVLEGYSAWRELCGLSTPVNESGLAGILGNGVLARKLLHLYGTAKNIDVWVGAISEPALPGGRVGPLLACLIAKQFEVLRDGDRFWWQNEGVFSSAQRDALRTTSLSRIICDNTNIRLVPFDPFAHTLHPDDLLPCAHIGHMNLSAWREPDTDPVCGAVPRLSLGFSVLCESMVIYQCPTGYLLQGATQITCDPNTQQWTPQPPTCHDIDECSGHASVCPPHLQCLNTTGGHTCTEPAAPPLPASSIVASVMSVLGGVALIVLFLACYQRFILRKAEPVRAECCQRRS
ncbi:hypothetical protein cypCar_00027161, partial [Cyprinus carpio]